MAEDPPSSDAAETLAATPPPLPLQVPPELTAALNALEARPNAIDSHEIHREIRRAVPDRQALAPELRRGAWAEQAAFAFSNHSAPGGGPWGTHFKPMMSGENTDGTAYHSPDIVEIDVEVLAYWAARARSAKHPALVARFADLVWDLTPVVTNGQRAADAIGYVRLAIDGYIAASRMDGGTAWGETRESLGRALQLAMSVNDAARIAEAAKAHIEYVDRTSDDDKVGTYCYLFDNLLPKGNGPRLEPQQEAGIIAMFEAKLAAMAVPGGGWDVDPFGPQSVGMRLAAYYQRKGLLADRVRVIRVVAEAFERRARIGDALSGVMFLENAREHFLLAGLREEADRIQLEAEKLGPEAVKRLARTTVSHEVPTADLENYLKAMISGGLEVALQRFVFHFVPDQAEIAARDEAAKEHPLHAMFMVRPVKLGDSHIEADVGDSSGDPDGLMVHRTAEALQFQVPWMSWTLDRLVTEGLTAEYVVSFVEECPLLGAERFDLIRRGIHAHFLGDYIQVIHLLIPQIEHAVVSLAPLTGKASTKPHRTGRGVMQFKNLNDMLPKVAWPVPGDHGENLRMYLLSALAHPKGLNIRNEVCHGLWAADRFTRQVSERVLHVLLTASLLRVMEVEESEDPDASRGVGPDVGNASVEP
jgi:lysyl-tRNA synthetase class 1